MFIKNLSELKHGMIVNYIDPDNGTMEAEVQIKNNHIYLVNLECSFITRLEDWSLKHCDIEILNPPQEPIKSKKTDLRDMEVGDILIDDFGKEFEVLEVGKNTFAKYVIVEKYFKEIRWFTFKEAENKSWKFKETEKSLTELVQNELDKDVSYYKKENETLIQFFLRMAEEIEKFRLGLDKK